MEPTFDFLVAVYFDDILNVTEAYQIPHTIVRECAKFTSYQNGYILNSTAMKAVIKYVAVESMTELLQDAQ